MNWKNSNLISENDMLLLSNEVSNICKQYDVVPPHKIEISKQLRACDGMYIVYEKDNKYQPEIKIAYKHYTQFGIKSFIRVLRHELAHHICWIKNSDIKHSKNFKDICLNIDGCLNDHSAKGKYESLKYEGIETPYKWRYTCPLCKKSIKTKRKITQKNYECLNCGLLIETFIIEKLKEK